MNYNPPLLKIYIPKICKSVTYEKISKGNYVFREGDPSNNKFYVILSGVISIIFKNNTNVFIEENKRRNSHRVSISVNRRHSGQKNNAQGNQKGDPQESSKLSQSESLQNLPLPENLLQGENIF